MFPKILFWDADAYGVFFRSTRLQNRQHFFYVAKGPIPPLWSPFLFTDHLSFDARGAKLLLLFPVCLYFWFSWFFWVGNNFCVSWCCSQFISCCVWNFGLGIFVLLRFLEKSAFWLPSAAVFLSSRKYSVIYFKILYFSKINLVVVLLLGFGVFPLSFSVKAECNPPRGEVAQLTAAFSYPQDPPVMGPLIGAWGKRGGVGCPSPHLLTRGLFFCVRVLVFVSFPPFVIIMIICQTWAIFLWMWLSVAAEACCGGYQFFPYLTLWHTAPQCLRSLLHLSSLTIFCYRCRSDLFVWHCGHFLVLSKWKLPSTDEEPAVVCLRT